MHPTRGSGDGVPSYIRHVGDVTQAIILRRVFHSDNRISINGKDLPGKSKTLVSNQFR